VANSSQIGAIHVEASINSGKFVDGAKKIKAAAKDTEVGVKKSFGGMQTAVGSSMGALKAGAAGFVAALSVGLFTRVIGNALKYAASLKTVSDQLNVTTKDLQTLRYAAQQWGVSQQDLDNGLERLSVTLGKVAAGAKEPTRAIEAIGLSADKLKGKNTAEALKLIADRLSEIPDQAQRAAVETALFGEAGAKLDGLLRKGSGGINALAQAAEELGIVLSEEDIRKADETAKKLESLKTVLQARIAGVVAENADAILALADALSTVADWAIKVIGLMGRLSDAVGGFSNVLRGVAGGFNPAFLNPAMFGGGGSGLSSSATVTLPPARPVGGGRNIGKFLAGSGGGRKRTPRAPKDTSLRDAFQFESEMRRAEMDILRALQSLSTDYIERGQLSLQMLDLEKRAYEAELKYEVASKGKTQAQADQLLAEYNKKDALERQAVLADREAQRYEESVRLDDLTLSLERDRLESQAQLAETASERRDIELRILDLVYRQEKALLEAVIADEQSSFAAKEEARRRLANLGQTYDSDRQGVINSTRGPMEDYLASLPTTAAKAQEALEKLQVQGFEGLIDAALELSNGFDSAADSLLKTLRNFFLGMARTELQRGLGSLLQSSGIFGNVTGAISESGASFFGGADLSFASGGSFNIKGRPGVDRNLLSINGLPVANVSYGERISVSNDNARTVGQSRGGVTMNFYTPDSDSFRRNASQTARIAKRKLGI
jgi:hypothetical protein